jgi:quinol monooxygenase YgiN
MPKSNTTPKPTLWVSAGLKISNNQSAEQAKEALKILQFQTIKEKGCIFFDVLQHRDDPNSFTLWEEWVNEEALKEHFSQTHTKDYLAQSLTEVSYIEKLVKLT